MVSPAASAGGAKLRVVADEAIGDSVGVAATVNDCAVRA